MRTPSPARRPEWMLETALVAGIMDQTEVLSTKVLTLSEDIKEGFAENDRFIIKNEPAKTYLTLTRDQWRILVRFRGGNTLATVLPVLVEKRITPALMDLYELILKSVRAEVLVPKGLEEEGSFHRALDWRMQMTWKGAVGIGLFCFFFGIAGLLFNYAVAIPTSFGEGLVGYLLVIFALSVGQVLAACLLRYYDCEVYYPYIDWRTLLPHFRLDLGDAVMAGRFCGIGIGLLRMAPLFLVTGMCAFSFPRFAFPLLAGCGKRHHN